MLYFWLDTLALLPSLVTPLKQYCKQFFVMYLIASLLLALAAEAWEFWWNPSAPGEFYTGPLSDQQLQDNLEYNRDDLRELFKDVKRWIGRTVDTCKNFGLKYGLWAVVVSTFVVLIAKVIVMVWCEAII